MVSQQTGRDKVPPARGINMVDSVLVSSQECEHSSRSCSWGSQCHCRHSVKEGSDPSHRVGSRSVGIQTSVYADVHTYDRSVCNQIQQTSPSVCFSSPGFNGIGYGCFSDRLESKIPIRFSASESGPKGADKILVVSSDRDATDSTVLGNQGSLHSASATQRDSANSFASGFQAPEAAAHSRFSPESQGSQPPCLLVEDSLSSQGFSAEVIERVLNPVRTSSKTVYDAKWNSFVSYCQNLDIDHVNISIPQLADFFEYLFSERKLQPQTVKGYRSALNLRLCHKLGDLGSNGLLNKLFRSFDRERPRSICRVQPWDLTLVLKALTKAPFEPLSTISLKFLSWKTVFLIALASGRRRSEIHAIRRSKIFHSEAWKSVTFRIDHFLCKNQSHTESGDFFNSFSIPSLSQSLDKSFKEDRTLCPVRALRYYLDRTEKEGKNKGLCALFVPLIETKKELSKASLSNWIKRCIEYILSNCSTDNAQEFKVKAHDVRSLAASWSLKGCFSIDEIMQACTWKNHSTFTRFYFKDALENDQGESRLAPFVAAQSIIKH